MENHLAASGPARVLAASGAGKPSVPIHAAALQPEVTPPSPAATSPPTPTRAPANADVPHPMPGSPGAHARSHTARLRPFDPKPAPALLGRAGSHAGGRPARAATLFRVLRPMRCAREQREKLTSGYFYNHARLRFPPLPARPRCMRLTRRKARHRGGPQSLRSKT